MIDFSSWVDRYSRNPIAGCLSKHFGLKSVLLFSVYHYLNAIFCHQHIYKTNTGPLLSKTYQKKMENNILIIIQLLQKCMQGGKRVENKCNYKYTSFNIEQWLILIKLWYLYITYLCVCVCVYTHYRLQFSLIFFFIKDALNWLNRTYIKITNS